MANNTEHDPSAPQHPDQSNAQIPGQPTQASGQPEARAPEGGPANADAQPTVPLAPQQMQPTGHGAPSQAAAPQYGAGAFGQAAGHAPVAAHEFAHANGQHAPFAGHGGSDSGGSGSNGNGAGSVSRSGAPKSRTGALLAGLAIGALLGGVMGGGVAAVVASNTSQQSVAQGGTSGAITLNNTENATAISGVAAVATPSVVTLEVSGGSASGSGSGVIYSSDGYIVTNAHVVTLDGAAANGGTVRVKLSDGRIFAGEVVGTDPYADLAVVKIEADNLQPIEIADSDKLDVGDLTVAIGAPLNLSNTVTSGVVSALNRGISVGSPLIPEDQGQPQEQQPDDGGSGGFPWDFRFGNPDEQQQPQQSSGGTVTLPVIQTDASINPGNSGGALLNGEGKLIGINVAIASTAGDSGTAGSVGLGFAIPSKLATRVADAIIDGDQPSHGLLGASVADSAQDSAASHTGGLLMEVAKGGAADQAGLKAGDIITGIDGASAIDGTSVSALVRVHEGGSEVTVDYIRNGKAQQAEVKLGTLEW